MVDSVYQNDNRPQKVPTPRWEGPPQAGRPEAGSFCTAVHATVLGTAYFSLRLWRRTDPAPTLRVLWRGRGQPCDAPGVSKGGGGRSTAGMGKKIVDSRGGGQLCVCVLPRLKKAPPKFIS